MKINRIQNYIINTDLPKHNDKNKPSPKETSKGVNIEISDSAKVLAEKIAQSNNIKYSEKVEKVRQAILNGSYKVSTEDIADKLIEAMKEQKDSDYNGQ